MDRDVLCDNLNGLRSWNLDGDGVAYRIARTASAEREQLLTGHVLEFHLTIADLPADPDEVTLQIGIGVAEPPSTSKFSAKVSWDDIEDVRAGDLVVAADGSLSRVRCTAKIAREPAKLLVALPGGGPTLTPGHPVRVNGIVFGPGP